MIRIAATARHALLAGVLLLAVLGLACGLADALANTPSASPSDDTTVLRVGWPREPDNLNPFLAQAFSSYQVLSLNYDVLVGLDPSTLAPAKGPSSRGLATDWTTSSDGKTWTFTLRHDATWQDGSGPVTARDVAFTYNLIIDNDLSAFTIYTSGIMHVTAVDDFTVRFDCAQPKADMLYGVNLIWILPEHVWSRVPAKTLATSYANKLPIVGSGPFQTTVFRQGSYVKMVAYKDYWRGAPQIDEVLFENYTNQDTMAQDMKAGAIDACTGLLPAQLRTFAGDKTVTAASIPANGFDDLVFNCYDPPADGKSLGHPVLRDWHFRQALQWAVDKQKICDLVFDGNARPADMVIVSDYYHDPDWHWTPPESEAYHFDLAKAGQLLDAAGYTETNGDGFREYQGKPIELRLCSRTENTSTLTEARLIAGWFRQIGLKIDLQGIESNALVDRIYNTVDGELAPDFDMFIWGWYNSLEPGDPLGNFTTAQINGWSDSAYSNPTFDGLWAEQNTTLDTARRKQLIHQLQQIIYEESPYVVLTYSADIEAWNTAKWTGWQRTPRGNGNVVIPVTGNDTYLSVQPKIAAATTDSGARGVAWLVAGVLTVAAVLIVVVAVRRRRSRALEEAG